MVSFPLYITTTPVSAKIYIIKVFLKRDSITLTMNTSNHIYPVIWQKNKVLRSE